MTGATIKKNLRTGRSLWADSPGLGVPVRPLKAAISVDVAIVGAGISGAFMAHELSRDHTVAVLDRRPHELSGGQRQRVLIALALACGPKLLIADEPTTALDVMVQAQVLALLEELQREQGLALLFITHDLSVLTHTCQRLAVMYAGRIVEEGASKEVFVDPRHPYSRALAAAFPTIGDPSSRMNPTGLAGDPPDPSSLPAGCPFQPRCSVAIAECSTLDVALRHAGVGRTAACVHVDGVDV